MASWLARRLFPALASAVLIAVGMFTTIVGPEILSRTAWALPNDLWGTLIAAQRLLHLHLSGLYTQPTGLVAFPGAVVILLPAVALMDAAGIPVQPQTPVSPYPHSWLVAGPYEIVISCVVLFAIDSLAERRSVRLPQRFFLTVASAVALWSVSVRWGHPEDAVAVALLLYGIDALPRTAKAGWLIGAAVVVQPLVLLALPVVAVAVLWPDGVAAEWIPGDGLSTGAGRLAGFLIRAALPSVAALAAAAAANWHATVTAVTSQPNYPSIDHPTPWTSLSPHLSNGDVAGGPGRILAIVFACGCAVGYAYRRRTAGPSATELLWWVAVTLAIRCVFESVMVAYYVWPSLAVALLVAADRWTRLIPTAILAAAVTFASQAPWRNPWGWWALIVTGLALTLYSARIPIEKTMQNVAKSSPAAGL